MSPIREQNETKVIFGFAELNAGHHKEAVSLLQEIEKDYLAFQFKYDEGYDIVENLGIAFMELEKYDLAIEAFKGAPLGKRNIFDGLNKIFILLITLSKQNKYFIAHLLQNYIFLHLQFHL